MGLLGEADFRLYDDVTHFPIVGRFHPKCRAHVPAQELQGIELSNRVNAERRFFIRRLGKARAQE